MNITEYENISKQFASVLFSMDYVITIFNRQPIIQDIINIRENTIYIGYDIENYIWYLDCYKNKDFERQDYELLSEAIKNLDKLNK